MVLRILDSVRCSYLIFLCGLYLWEFRVFFPARLPEESDRYGRGWDGLFVIANRRVKECAVSAPTCGRGRRKGGTDQVHFDDRN